MKVTGVHMKMSLWSFR